MSKKLVKNTYTLLQVKKMIGKKLIIPWKNISIMAESKDKAKKLKRILLKNPGKRLVIIASCMKGILNVVDCIEKYLAITMLSYSDIKKHKLEDFEIVIIQHRHLKAIEIKKMFKYI